MSGLRYRKRYQSDPEFRASEIARRWANKVRESHQLATLSDGTLTPHVLRQLFAVASHCHYCATPMRSQDKSLDHVIPKSRGGLHSIQNVVIACKRCNSAKHARTPEEWKGAA